MRLTAIILTKNEEKTIRRCIRSLGFCDEIIVIDDESIDRTCELAKKSGAIVIKRNLRGNYAEQRNYAMGKSSNDWILFVDADEVVSKALAREIMDIFRSNIADYDGYFITRRDILWGKKLNWGESGKMKLLRLGNRKKGRFKRAVHETWDIEGKIGSLRGDLEHYSHVNIKNFINKINSYSKIHVGENLKEGKRSSLTKILILPLMKFFNNYFYRLGFLDGVKGFVVSVIMSMHSFVSWSSLWLLQRKYK